MGWVWNILLSFDNEELWVDGEDEPRKMCEPLQRINAWLALYGRLVSLIEPTYKKHAGYGMDANLYGGGFKHLDIDGFIEVVKAQDWKARSKVQLWVKGAEEGMGEEPFALIKLGRAAPSPPSARAAAAKPAPRARSKRKGRRT
jgi:hypothetical protein